MARAVMLQGTGSDVGKSVLVAALCRAARRRGLTVRPFKPQNMSNNAAVADDGGEVGRAQWLQALACEVPVSVHMNPVLLKPENDMGSQVIVHGKILTTAKARQYQAMKTELIMAVKTSFQRLCNESDLVLVEGAGSPAEVNLRRDDIANMGFATPMNVPVCLVGDIDRGGVIASLVGTHMLLSDEDRAMVRGFLINKFRGDLSLFEDGIQIIRKHTGWQSFGVMPWLEEMQRLPAEDSVVLDRFVRSGSARLVVAVPVLQRIANFDDLDPLAAQEGVEIIMVANGEKLPERASLVILLGSKTTISDLAIFRRNGWDRQLARHVVGGGHVIGICGGYQMLGKLISDPQAIEGSAQTVEGLGLLDVETILKPEKQVRNVQAISLQYNVSLHGYEIHMGQTWGTDCEKRPMLQFEDRFDGAISSDGRVMGCYLHGLFCSDEFRTRFLADFGIVNSIADFATMLDETLDFIAERTEQSLDVDGLLNCAGSIA